MMGHKVNRAYQARQATLTGGLENFLRTPVVGRLIGIAVDISDDFPDAL